MINEVRKHVKILESHQRGEIRRKEKYQELERKYIAQEKRDKISDRRVETGTLYKNSKAEEIYGESEPV